MIGGAPVRRGPFRLFQRHQRRHDARRPDRRRRGRRTPSAPARLARPADQAGGREDPQGRFRGDPGRPSRRPRNTSTAICPTWKRSWPRPADGPAARPGPAHLPPARPRRRPPSTGCRWRRSTSTRSAPSTASPTSSAAAIGLDLLGVERVTSRSVPTGNGMVKCAHGLMPIPAPGTAELLKGVPLAASSIKARTDHADRRRHPHDRRGGVGRDAGHDDGAHRPRRRPARVLEQPNLLRLFVGVSPRRERADRIRPRCGFWKRTSTTCRPR